MIARSSRIFVHAYTKSSAVTGSPSLHLTPSFRRNRYSSPSLETRMLSAIAGTTFSSRSTIRSPWKRCEMNWPPSVV